jgi:UDP-N-acetylglucosamine 2-epimerase (non-hydrolysing)
LGNIKSDMSKMSSTIGPILCVVGARPNFMKIAPIMAAFQQSSNTIPSYLVHTGQHYDADMKASFFTQLGIPEPDVDLGVGSGSHAIQTAEIMRRFEPVLDEVKPAAILVVGDVNSTIACALVATKKGIPVIHVEAGLRSYDRGMPEEVNRVLTDQISDLLFTTEASARDNLLREGIDQQRIQFVGNVMIDTLINHKARAVSAQSTIQDKLGEDVVGTCSSGYAVLTMHRPSNVDEPVILERLIKVIAEISEHIPVIFSVHPRTKQALNKAGLMQIIDRSGHFYQLPPLGYLELLGLMKGARLVLTDSGGLQEETTALGVPCVTLRENTERPITVDQGTNTIVGTDVELIRTTIMEILQNGGKAGRLPELWDGKAALRIKNYLSQWLTTHGKRHTDDI